MEKIIAEGFLLTHSEIASDKIDAYQATHYRVGYGENAFSLRIGTRSEALLRLYEATKQACGDFITAFNPYGTVQLDEVNEVAHARLGEHLRAIAPHVIEGAGDDQIGVWPEEKSFFALGVNEDVARLLGNRFHQDAVVWTGPDARNSTIASASVKTHLEASPFSVSLNQGLEPDLAHNSFAKRGIERLQRRA